MSNTGSRNLDNEEALAYWGPLFHGKKDTPKMKGAL